MIAATGPNCQRERPENTRPWTGLAERKGFEPRILSFERRGGAGSGFQIPRRPWRRIWRIALQARPRSADRTRSPAAISQKREFFKCPPETIGYFAPRMPKIGARRLVANSQKPAIGGPLCEYQGQFLLAPDCLAGDAVLIAPVSRQIPC
jgi:hypothetical protein